MSTALRDDRDSLPEHPSGERKTELGFRIPGRNLLGAFSSMLLLLSACSLGSSDLPSELPEGPCPPPGVGISIGGWGGAEDAVTTPLRRLVLGGGGPENDEAVTLFLEAAEGGDVLILRTDGSLYAYPNYFLLYLTPSVQPASANTILTTLPEYGDDESVLCRLGYAEAVWLPGGNRWDYLGRWPSGLHATLVEFLEGGGALGGSGEGAASLGEAAFDAEDGSVTSEAALQDPLSEYVGLSYPPFSHPDLRNTLVESHFSQRNREGRLLVFLARFLAERQKAEVLGVGLDEEIALVIDDEGFRVMGPPERAAWVYRVTGPATLEAGEPLNLQGVRRIKLEPGSEGEWPPDFEALQGVELKVEGGVVGPG